jgi:tRNA-2-methylthio-N6-dimethylallyladenosine synthase
LLTQQQKAFNASMVGRTLPVLFERPGRHAGQILGRSPYLQAVHVDGPASLIGQIAPVRIGQGNMNSLTGDLVHVPVGEPA